MLPSIIDDTAARVRVQYGLFTLSLRGAVAQSIEGIDPADPMAAWARLRYRQTASAINTLSLSAMDDDIAAAIDKLTGVAIATATKPLNHADLQTIHAHVADVKADLQTLLAGCAKRDSEVGEQHLRKCALSMDLTRSVGSPGSPIAALGARRTMSDGLKFEQRDKLGRRWTADNYVYVAVRGHLLQAYIDACLFVQAKCGNDLVCVKHPDYEGRVMSISGATEGYPKFNDERDRIFHPQSNAFIEIIK